MSAIFSTCGVKPEGDEVVETQEAENDAVESLLFLVPDHAKTILYVDHHEAMHASFANADFMRDYLAREYEEFTACFVAASR
jgi:hypothetical protein